MPIVEWNVSLVFGVPEIDQHHQHLVQLLNESYDQFREGVEVPLSVIDEIVRSSADEFSYEEALMAGNCYPRLAEHKTEHEVFSCRILELQKTYRQRGNVSVELLWFLCNWVTHHIRETHAELGQFLDGVSLRNSLHRQNLK